MAAKNGANVPPVPSVPSVKKGRPRSSDRDDATARIDRQVLKEAKVVADLREISVAEYLSELVRVPVRRDFVEETGKVGGAAP